MTGLDDIDKIMRDRTSKIDDRVKNNRPMLLIELRRLKVKEVSAEYDGSGDSGQLEEPTLAPEPEPGVVVPPVSVLVDGGWSSKQGEIAETRTKAIIEAVQDLFYDLLEMEHPGWEINEGSYGSLVWAMDDDKVRLVHNERIESVETSEDEL